MNRSATLYRLRFVPVLLLLALSFNQAEAQRFPFAEELVEPAADGLTFEEVQQVGEAYFAERPELLEEHDGAWQKFKRWEWFWESRTLASDGAFPAADHNYQAWVAFVEKNGESILAASSAAAWQPLGPNRLDAKTADGLGRLNMIAFHPSDPNTFWVGAPAGGLWKTTNFGQTWQSNTDQLPVLGVSDMVIHPTNPQVMYIATGDGDLGSLSGVQTDKPFKDGDTRSIGILKSINGGATWQTTGLQFNVAQRVTIRRLWMDPGNPNVIVAASSVGLLRTADGGDSWSVVANGYFMDLEGHPTNRAVLYASTYAGGQGNPTIFARSLDGGVSWEATVANENIQRIKIGVTPAQPNRVDLLCAGLDGGLFGIFSSANGGASFEAGGYLPDGTQNPNLLGWYNGMRNRDDFGKGQGFYDLAYAIDPVAPGEIYVGGVNTWKTTDGAINWKLANFWIDDAQIRNIAGANGVDLAHADKHFLRFHPLRTNTLFECNDGGLWVTTDKGNTWTSLTNGLDIGQIYRLNVAASEPNTVIIGRQDNGSHVFEGGVWRKAFGGDGMECAIDQSNPDIMYHSVFNGNFFRSTNRFREPANQRASISENIPGFGQSFQGAWVTPFVIDPNQSSTIYTGMYHVWRSDNRGDAWQQISPMNVSGTKKDVNGNPLPLQIRAMDVSPLDSRTIYIGTFEDISATFDGGANWVDIGFRESEEIALTDIEAHPSRDRVCFVSLSGYEAEEKVYAWVENAWVNLTYNLPNVPVNVLEYDELGGGGLFAGTDIGVFHLNLDVQNPSWQPLLEELPRVPITDLEHETTQNTLTAATFGRGAWRISLGSGSAGEVSGEQKSSATVLATGTDGVFRLKLAEHPAADEEYAIFNYVGERVTGGPVPTQEEIIDLSNQPVGLYYLALQSEGFARMVPIRLLR